MKITPEFVAAVAAIVAALLSGTTLYVSGRREERKWRRETLMEAMVRFLDGSLARYSEKAFRKKGEAPEVAKYVNRAYDGLHSQNIALTRLRLLGSEEVVRMAENILRVDNDARVAFEKPAPVDESEYGLLIGQRSAARRAYLDACRKQLGVKGSAATLAIDAHLLGPWT